MICEECGKNPSTVHLTKIINGKVSKMHLCQECAKKHKNFDFDSSFSIHNFLTGLLDNTNDGKLSIEHVEKYKCEKCGMTYGRFRQTGRIGCSNCYNSFREKLVPLLKRIHGHDNHIGKVPKKAGGVIRIRKEIEALRTRLDEAVRKEEFESAVKLRDKIRELQKTVETK